MIEVTEYIPRPQKEVSLITFANNSSSSKSTLVAVLLINLSNICTICVKPSLHGVHLPHDSYLKNLILFLSISNKSKSLLITITAPDPIAIPLLFNSS